MSHPLWFILLLLILIWYITVTVVVSYRGAKDIKSMIGREGSNSSESTEEPSNVPTS